MIMNKLKTSNSEKFVLLFGDNETGKSSILLKYTKNSYGENYRETIGFNVGKKEIEVNDISVLSQSKNREDLESTNVKTSYRVTLTIWDVSGKEQENKIIFSHFFKSASGYIICCSYDRLESLINVKNWISYIKSKTPIVRTDIPLIILCNKFDIPAKERKFGSEDISCLLKEIINTTASEAPQFNIKLYHEVSAKNNTNIHYVFSKMLNLIFGISPKDIILKKAPSQMQNNSMISSSPKNNKLEMSFEMKNVKHNRTFQLKNSKLDPKNCYSKCCK